MKLSRPTWLAGFLVVCCSITGNPALSQVRPCGQVQACPPITLQGPIPLVGRYGQAQDPIYPSLPPGFIEQEYFFSGTANVFNYNQDPAVASPTPGANLVVQIPNAPYKTRMIVVRPGKAGPRFSGDVVIEFFNSSAGFDSDPAYLLSGQFFARKGWIYIGVTTSANQSINYLKQYYPRYASLTMVDNGQEYEIISQLVTALKSRTPGQVPLPFKSVRRVYVVGESQQAGSAITHANEFSFPLIDGYTVISNPFARTLGGIDGVGAGGPVNICDTAGAQPYPNCFAELPVGQNLIRTDLPMPVYHFMTETDVNLDPQFFSGSLFRQADADTPPGASYRLVEIPATAHNVDVDLQVLPNFTLADFCENPAFGFTSPITGSDVVDAMWWNMYLQATTRTLPPHAPRITTDSTGAIVRDSLQNAEGGVRLPELSYPMASYYSPVSNPGKPVCTGSPNDPPCLPAFFANLAPLVCFLSGSYAPLSTTQLQALYPDHDSYVADITTSALGLLNQRFLLPEDAIAHIQSAIDSTIGN